MNPTNTKSWQQLAAAANSLTSSPLAQLVDDRERAADLRIDVAGITFDFARQWVDANSIAHLLGLAQETRVRQQARAMLAGEPINASEDRAVLHTALRGGADADPAIDAEVAETQQRMRQLARDIRTGAWRGYRGDAIRDIVHIGIGGSHLGPELAVRALGEFADDNLRVHFVANIDAHELRQALKGLDPATTLFIVVSKSFTTLETQVNAASARSWFLERTSAPEAIAKHFIAVTTNLSAAAEFGLGEENLLPMWDWVGGRFSLWSAVGLPLLCAIGERHYQAFLDGAKLMDNHFAEAPDQRNAPLLSALFATWNYNFLGAASLAVLSYDERLALLPDYLQQLEMESNGKSVDSNGQTVDYHTMPILWGGTGTKGQHAYHQLLHQGTRAYAADFIVVDDQADTLREHRNWLNANALAQGQAMASGFAAPANEAYRNVPGNHPNTTMVLDGLTPGTLGALLATYEHKVFCQGAIWGINSFDQWGVELGKQLAKPIYAALQQNADDTAQDAATAQLIERLRS